MRNVCKFRLALADDGTIVLATMAIVALAEYPEQRRNRRFFWVMLGSAALVSVSGNASHALLPRDAPLNPWLAAAIATVAPLSSRHTWAGDLVAFPSHSARCGADGATRQQVEAVAGSNEAKRNCRL